MVTFVEELPMTQCPIQCTRTWRGYKYIGGYNARSCIKEEGCLRECGRWKVGEKRDEKNKDPVACLMIVEDLAMAQSLIQCTRTWRGYESTGG